MGVTHRNAGRVFAKSSASGRVEKILLKDNHTFRGHSTQGQSSDVRCRGLRNRFERRLRTRVSAVRRPGSQTSTWSAIAPSAFISRSLNVLLEPKYKNFRVNYSRVKSYEIDLASRTNGIGGNSFFQHGSRPRRSADDHR